MIIKYPKSNLTIFSLHFNPNSYFIPEKIALLLALIFCLFIQAFGQTKTLGLTKNLVGSTGDGYVLFAPMGSKTTYLIDKCGKKVHSWVSAYSPGLSVYLLPDGHLLRTGILNDTFFVASGKGGIIEKMDWNGNVVWSYKLSNDSLCQHHDIHPMENGNILVIAWHGISATDAELKGRMKGSIGGPKLWSERILELKPKGTNQADVVWQWSLIDHIVQDASISKPDFNMISAHPELMNINFIPMSGPDWIHMNSLDYNKQLDQIVVSCHNNSEIWVIDHSTNTSEAATHMGGKSGMGGDLMYRWGNPIAYNKGTKSNQKFFKQHNAQWIPKGYKDEGGIMVFNNGLGRSPSYSSVEIIMPPVNSFGDYNALLPYGPSDQKWIYKDSVPTTFYSAVISGATRLHNGNTLICSGNSGKFFEVNDKNKVVWQYINPVSSGDVILTDGETPTGNAVFRCIYYPESYAAFNNKTLVADNPIEKSSYTYSCQPSNLDLTAPYPLALVPLTGANKIAVDATFHITFNENVNTSIDGVITIYQNNQWMETLSARDSGVSITNNTVNIKTKQPFHRDSKISIAFTEGCFIDASGNKCHSMDTSTWYFFTVSAMSTSKLTAHTNPGFYPNPTSGNLYTKNDQDPSILKILDHSGRQVNFTVKQEAGKEYLIDLQQLKDGVYFIQTTQGLMQKIVKINSIQVSN